MFFSQIYTKAELPFCKLNDNSVLERLKGGSLEWPVPDSMPDALANLLVSGVIIGWMAGRTAKS